MDKDLIVSGEEPRCLEDGSGVVMTPLSSRDLRELLDLELTDTMRAKLQRAYDMVFITSKRTAVREPEVPTVKFRNWEDWEKEMEVKITWEEFYLAVEAGGFIDYDGSGCFATETTVSDLAASPVKILSPSFTKPTWATHVAWYNK